MSNLTAVDWLFRNIEKKQKIQRVYKFKKNPTENLERFNRTKLLRSKKTIPCKLLLAESLNECLVLSCRSNPNTKYWLCSSLYSAQESDRFLPKNAFTQKEF